MPIIPCENRITCEGVDTPVSNFSSEAPDLFDFRTFFWVLWDPNFPLPPDLSGRGTGDLPIYWAQGCDTICLSLVSQQDANACAQRNAYLCGRNNEGSDGTPPVLFSNAAQTCTAICADGSPFSYTVPAGWFTTTSQTLSDQVAHTAACQLANSLMTCLSRISQGCLNVPYGEFITITRGTPPFTFTLLGGTLPPGITFAQFDGTSALLSGTPTTAGNYLFTVRARNAQGAQVIKQYTLAIIGITNFASAPTVTKNAAYSFQLAASGGSAPYVFSLASGSLPAGLTLSSTGLISGTPTTVETANFVIAVHDASTGGASCQLVASLTVVNPVACPTLLTSLNVNSSRGMAAYAPLTSELLHPNKVYASDGFNQQFRVYDADTQTFIRTINYGPGWTTASAAYAPGTDKLFVVVDDFGLGSWYIQIVNTQTDVLGATIVDGATGALFGYYGLKYVSANNRVVMLGTNGGNANTDLLELNPGTNAFTRFTVTIDPGGGASDIATEFSYCPDNNRYYVGTSQTTGLNSFLRSFNATTHAQTSSVDFGVDQITGVCWVSDVSRLYVFTKDNLNVCKVHVYNVTTDLVETVITLGNVGNVSSVTAYWPNKGLLVLPVGAGTGVIFVDPQANTVTCTIASPQTSFDPVGVAGNNLWYSGFAGASLKVYN